MFPVYLFIYFSLSLSVFSFISPAHPSCFFPFFLSLCNHKQHAQFLHTHTAQCTHICIQRQHIHKSLTVHTDIWVPHTQAHTRLLILVNMLTHSIVRLMESLTTHFSSFDFQTSDVFPFFSPV